MISLTTHKPKFLLQTGRDVNSLTILLFEQDGRKKRFNHVPARLERDGETKK